MIRSEQHEGKRLKFRVNQEDRHRQQVIAYGLGITKADAIWAVLFPLTLLDDRSLWNLTRDKNVQITGYHPLKQIRITARSWHNEVVVI